MRDNRISLPNGNSRSRVTVKSFKAGLDAATDESVMSLLATPDTYNYRFVSGVLREGYGLREAGLPHTNVAAVWTYTRFDSTETRDDRMMLMDVSGVVRERRVGTETFVPIGLTLSAPPSVMNYRLYGEDVVLMCTASDGMYVYNGIDAPYRAEDVPYITSMTLHYERLFCTVDGEQNAVWYSDDLDPTNFTVARGAGGFIQLVDERGSSGRVISYNGYIYIFREYGISRLTAYADENEFALVNLFVSSGRIEFDTVQLCGDRILFLASDGLYAFDGYDTVRLLKKLDGVLLSVRGATAAYADGLYCLAFRMRTDANVIADEAGAYTNNGLLVYRPSSGEISLSRGMDIVRLCADRLHGRVLAVTAQGRLGEVAACGTYFDVPLLKKWRIPRTDFSAAKGVRVTEISLFSRHDCTLTLESDTARKTVRVAGKPKVQHIRCAFSGDRVGLDILSSAAEAEIAAPAVTIRKNK